MSREVPKEETSKIDHIALFTTHPTRMINFYINKLKFKKEHQAVLDKGTVYSIFKIKKNCNMVKLKTGEVTLEIFWFKADKLKPRRKSIGGYNHFGLAFKDREKFLGEFRKERGVKVIEIKRKDRYTYFINDPDRNLIEIREL